MIVAFADYLTGIDAEGRPLQGKDSGKNRGSSRPVHHHNVFTS
jgi:hypothetical protein